MGDEKIIITADQRIDEEILYKKIYLCGLLEQRIERPKISQNSYGMAQGGNLT